MPAKLDRCVKKVKEANKRISKKVNPYAVCSKSTEYVKKKGGRWGKE